MADESTIKVVVEYIKSKDYRIVAATGVWGGVTPQGEVICNFFVEQSTVPGRTEITLDTQGKVLKERTEKGGEQKTIDRELQIGVIMRPDIAKVIGQWLIAESDKISPLLDSTKKH